MAEACVKLYIQCGPAVGSDTNKTHQLIQSNQVLRPKKRKYSDLLRPLRIKRMLRIVVLRQYHSYRLVEIWTIIKMCSNLRVKD